ncbi:MULTISPECIES: MFS transporter [unclassified Pseudomonas]|uniref:MFS transporter n=1 Tax=Pseudomonas TaxID=286 RepID=UPI000D01769A|nr:MULTISPECIES: MFS transporter [unclassified Pseudomonas]PRN04604.1 MFS transporter [Pseudomonas sp. LLC-1]PYG81066.1 metabolite-proton symporter [Pseudomonas sp. RV120224-01c]PYG84565.1 metabolite-proton symporter [Pseudomonas sp. RV120224-01b]
MNSPAYTKVASEQPTQTTDMKKVAIASVIGTTVEWYDLFLFATASALVFNKIFFPGFDPLVGTLLAFGTFASAYGARIVGAALFGHFGDRLGRKSMLLISLLAMGAATFGIGLLPDYQSIGIWAPISLLTLRIIQGLALGGEWGGAVLMAVEHAPKHQRGLYGSWVQIGVPAGTMLANLVFLLIATTLSTEELLAWGWRIPFLGSVLLIALGLYIRLNIHETPSFKAVEKTGEQVKVPLFEVFRKYWKQVLLGGVATMSTGTSYNLIVAFGLTYGTQTLGFSRGEMLTVVLVSCAACIFMLPFFGALSDRIGRKPIIIGGIIAEALVAFPMFWLMDTKELPLVFAGYLLLMTAFAANYGPIATFLAELFGTRVRYSGLSISYMLSGLLGSAATPLVTTALLSMTGKGSSVAWYMVGSAVVSLVALLLLTETFNKDINTKARG